MYVSGGGNYRPTHLSAWRQKLKQQGRKQINRFAELLAEGHSITGAAQILGVSQQMGSKMMATIRRELGDQAR